MKRTTEQLEIQKLPPSQHVVTVPNAITAIGLGLTLDGARRGLGTRVGFTEAAVGKGLDLLDGALAKWAQRKYEELTHELGVLDEELNGLSDKDKRYSQISERRKRIQNLLMIFDRLRTSEFGAKADPVADKVANFATVLSLQKDTLVPPEILAIFAGQEAINGIAAVAHNTRHPNNSDKPTQAGRHGMFMRVTGLLALAGGEALARSSHAEKGRVAKTAGLALFGVGTAISAKATVDYISRAMKPEDTASHRAIVPFDLNHPD